MGTLPEPNPKQKGPSAANEPTTHEIESWNEDTLLSWIQQKLSTPLNLADVRKVFDAEIDGSAFLQYAGNWKFFQSAGLSFGTSVKLAILARETSKHYLSCYGRNSDS
jgi:hypothetical protein